jgi:sigma-B regulation protein RsbU (phosphoserine phosphatase)
MTKILVVEDEADLLGPLSQALREAGYAVDEASDGESALSQAQDAEYDAIVLDLMLPKMDGFSVLRHLRRSRTTPVLMLTARDAVQDRVTGLDLGADDYLLKPYELNELLARVRAMVRRGAGGALTLAEVGQMTGETLSRTVSTLESARRVQMRLAPTQLPDVPGVDIAAYYHAAQWLSGDYCDAWSLEDGRMAFVVADVAGKGLPAAIVMANLQAALHAATTFCPGDPARAMEYVNRHLAGHLQGGMFVTLFLGMLDVNNGRLEYVNAGHLPPVVVNPSGAAEPLPSPANTVLGIGAETFFAEERILAPGECVVAFTDGVTEAESPEGKLLGRSGAANALRAAADAPAQRNVKVLTEAVTRFRGNGPQADDVTVLAVRWLGIPAEEISTSRQILPEEN